MEIESTDYIKQLIDGMTYHEMLRAWRNAPAGDPLFQGETGQYFQKVMYEKKNALSPGEQVAVSKAVGW